ncbi:SDR family oxidoreductase [Enterovirga aerilata]|uniref:SDR family oxidoreductase n=1 Tax=Enterovirga aerilata TaxID=2730920 RepID=A0A849IH16_9HYPH|nr:SDR family oxidoreductase [Enterovirga sp. DB1703]NNM75227.1 SDR family oxidoreductase [Enterovirga sp. DB1703]
MAVQLKPVRDQVIVLTGASSGIGLATAHLAAERGARLVLVSRNGEALEQLAAEIRRGGGEAVAVVADVARREDLEKVAARAREAFGGFDTWVNNAGVSVYGTLEQIPLADHRRVFDVDYWGVVQGSLIAAAELRERGGAIINLGSVLSDRALVLQGPYCAAKHAVKAFTDTLRMELEHDGAPVSVTLIKPSAIDTPFFEHARSHIDSPGIRNPPPAYDPSLVAKAILHAAETPKRTVVVGFGGYAISLMGAHFPRLTDLLMEATGFQGQRSEVPTPPARRDNLYAPREDGMEHSGLPGGRRETSLYLEAQLHPVVTAAAIAGVAAAIGGILAARLSRPAARDIEADYRQAGGA